MDQEEGYGLIQAYLDIILLSLLVILTIGIIRIRNLVAVVMLSSLYSLVMAGLWVRLDAVDVAFTEAAVGAGITTVLLLGALVLIGSRERKPTRNPWIPLLVVAVTGAALIHGTVDTPLFGDISAPAHQHVAPYYIENTAEQTGVPNLVTAVLASYRGYDTLGEVTVIFTAGVGVLLLIGRLPRWRRRKRP